MECVGCFRVLVMPYFFFKKLVYFWLCWVFVAAQLFSSFGEQGLRPSCDVQASHCDGSSCCRAQVLGFQAAVVAAYALSRCGSRAPEHQLSCRGAQA